MFTAFNLSKTAIKNYQASNLSELHLLSVKIKQLQQSILKILTTIQLSINYYVVIIKYML